MKEIKNINTENVLKLVVDELNSKKAHDIKIYDVRNLTPFYDYMLIASTNNSTHVKSLVESTQEILKSNNIYIKNIEKDKNFDWIVVDCEDFVINIFHKTARAFYNLENIWADAKEFI